MSTLFTWIWQGLAIAGLTAVALRGMPRLSASTRHLTWWVALGAVLALPAVLALAGDGHAAGRVGQPADGASALVLPSVPGSVFVALAVLWALAAVVQGIRVIRGWRRIQALRRTSRSFDGARLAGLPLWSTRVAVAARPAELRVSDTIHGACALGFRRPVILVGRRLARALDDEALDHVLLHEQAHIDRYDDWMRLLQGVITAAAGLHPAVRWITRQIDLERELACDDTVVACSGGARRYAAALIEAATTAGPPSRALAIMPGATARRSALRRRVARLLDSRCDRGGRPRATPAAIALPVAALVACPSFAPLIVLEVTREQAPAAQGRQHAAVRELVEPDAAAPPTSQREKARRQLPAATQLPGASRLAAAPQPVGPNRSSASPAGGSLSQGARGLDSAQAPVPSRALPAPVDAPGVTARGPVGVSADAPATDTAGQWQALATSPATMTNNVASKVASGAGRSGLAVGRAFTRAGKAIASSF